MHMGSSFSFDTSDEVLHILASVRASSASTDQKNALRDLVLSYTNGGKDPSLKIQIEQQLQSIGVAPVEKYPTKNNWAEKTNMEFGSFRGTPSFSVSAPKTPAPTPKPIPVVTAPVPEPKPVPAPVAASVVAQPASVAIPKPQPVPVAVPTPTPRPVAPKPPAPVAPKSKPVPAPTPVAPAAAAAETSPAPSDASAIERVREIKKLVNEKVGNPVHLVDIDNAVGREYMAALLDAMKRINNGSSVSRAMERLEASYVAVEAVIKKKDSAQQPAPASQPTPAPVMAAEPVVPEAVPKPVSISEPVLVPKPVTSPAPVASEPQPAPTPAPTPVAPAPKPKPAPVQSEVQTVPISSSLKVPNQASDNSAERWDNAPSQIPGISKVPAVQTPPQSIPIDVKSSAPQQPVTQQPVPPPPASSPAPIPVKSLADTGTPLMSVNDLPSADSLKSSTNGDTLHVAEVNEGLNQLLMDWSLFKKSGLFGTGAKGIEHPLFKKVKDLQIPILLAGRFEGATQEIKQSITDYMNGWRYEQGIIYEQGETFEHYLRRVIRHILDLQK